MIQKFSAENYKSLQSFDIELGRINIFIGANGSGKTNILEAFALAGAIADDKVAREILVPRGIRWTDIEAMTAGFDVKNKEKNIVFSVTENNSQEVHLSLSADKKRNHTTKTAFPELASFLIYCPENTALRNFESEGQIEPLGIKGEGLFKHLLYLNKTQPDLFQKVKTQLQLIDWYEDFDIPKDLFFGEKRLHIKDRYTEEGFAYFDQRSANEGFLYLLFYSVLFVSPETPPFFAIDNIDNALNPKLCSELIGLLTRLAKEHQKQAILTTHNAALLDGLDLSDDEQRLFVIFRNADGHTKAKRILDKPQKNNSPLPLSERFLRGYLGGLPKNF